MSGRKSVPLLEVAQKILSEICCIENFHVLYTGLHADVGHCPSICYESQQYPRAKFLYAYVNGLHIKQLGRVVRMCDQNLCINPNHHISWDQTRNDGTEPDGNGWNATMRTYLTAKIGLLDKDISEACILRNSENQQTKIMLNNEELLSHVVSLRLKLGRPLLENMDTSHICHNRACVNPNHLVEESRRENLLRTIDAGLSKRVKLTKEIVLQIYNSTKKQREISVEFGIAQGCVSNIKCGKVWSHVTGHRHKLRKRVNRRNVIITEADRVYLKTFLMQNIEVVSSTNEDELKIVTTDHWIPKTKARTTDGYAITSFKGFCLRFHQLSIMVHHNFDRFLDTSKPDEFVRHKCRRRDCCNPDHLELGTKCENAMDRSRDNTQTKPGIDASMFARIVDKLEKNELSSFAIAKECGVTLTNVNYVKKIISRRST